MKKTVAALVTLVLRNLDEDPVKFISKHFAKFGFVPESLDVVSPESALHDASRELLLEVDERNKEPPKPLWKMTFTVVTTAEPKRLYKAMGKELGLKEKDLEVGTSENKDGNVVSFGVRMLDSEEYIETLNRSRERVGQYVTTRCPKCGSKDVGIFTEDKYLCYVCGTGFKLEVK